MSAEDLRMLAGYMATHYRLDDVDLQIVIPITGDTYLRRTTLPTTCGARILLAIDPQTARAFIERAEQLDRLTW